MATERDLVDLFERLAPEADALRARHRAQRPDGILGCSFGCLPAILLGAALALKWDDWYGHPRFWPYLGGALAAVAVGWAIGLPALKRYMAASADTDRAIEDALVRPLVELLVPGGVLSHPLQLPEDEWRRTMLFPVTSGAVKRINRVVGRVAGRDAVLDEVYIDSMATSGGGWTFYGWIVRFELPARVAGHLRVRLPAATSNGRPPGRGFETFDPETARLGEPYTIDAAPPDFGAPAPDVDGSGIAPVVLLTDALFERLRASGTVQVAATGRELWVVARRGPSEAFTSSSMTGYELESWRRAAATLGEVAAVAEAVFRAVGRA
jgi:hypothetical protein